MTASEGPLDLLERVERTTPDAVELARRVSLAVWVEPELLRQARLALRPRLSAAAEADLWFSELVEGRSARALTLRPTVAGELRRQLAMNEQRLDQAWHIISKAHIYSPNDISLEEQVTWLAVRGRPEDLRRIEELLMSVAVAMVEEGRAGLAHWAGRALPLLPAAVQDLEAACLLAAGAYARLGDSQALASQLTRGGMPKNLQWVMPRQVRTSPVAVRLLDGVLELGDTTLSGSAAIDLPADSPSLVEVSWDTSAGRHTESLTVAPGGVTTVSVGPGPVTVRTTLGVMYTLRPHPLRLHFQSPTAGIDGDLPARLAEFIDAAQASLDVAVQAVDHPAILDAFKRCVDRGVALRIAFNATRSPDYSFPTEVALSAAGLLTVAKPVESGSSIAHCFLVRDATTVWTGSAWFTVDGLELEDTTCLAVHSAELAKQYLTAFNGLVADGLPFAGESIANVTLGDVQMKPYFMPWHAEVLRTDIADLLAGAKRVSLIAAGPNGPTALDSLAAFRSPTADIRGIWDRRMSKSSDRPWFVEDSRFVAGGATNNSLLIVDDQVVITGTPTFSDQRVDRWGNLLRVDSLPVAAAYTEYFERLYAIGAPPHQATPSETGTAAMNVSAAQDSGPEAISPAHLEAVVNALQRDRVVLVLGAGANLVGYSPGTSWRPGQGLPSGAELAEYLARRSDYSIEGGWDLTRVAQLVAVTDGTGALYEDLHRVFDVDYQPTPVHELCARLPEALRSAGGRPPLLVTTNFDDLLEQALNRANEPFDLISYVAEGHEQGRFMHQLPDGQRRIIDRPNEYVGLAVDERTTVLKLLGSVDRKDPERDSYVISEDDYIEYLSRGDTTLLLPPSVVVRLRRSSMLFLGQSLRDWALRATLRRVSSTPPRYSSWAIQRQPDPIDVRLWGSRGVEILEASLDEYVSNLRRALQMLPP